MFNRESDISGITDSHSGCGPPHNVHPTAKINKVKDLAPIFFDQCLYPIKTASSVKNILSKRSVFLLNFFHSYPFNETFIVNGKSLARARALVSLPFLKKSVRYECIEYKLFSLTCKILATLNLAIFTAWSLFNPLVIPVPHLLSPLLAHHLLNESKWNTKKIAVLYLEYRATEWQGAIVSQYLSLSQKWESTLNTVRLSDKVHCISVSQFISEMRVYLEYCEIEWQAAIDRDENLPWRRWD